MEIHFGALAKPLREQLKGVGLEAELLRSFDEDAKAIVRLHIGGILPDSAVHKARQRLLKKIDRYWNTAQKGKQ